MAKIAVWEFEGDAVFDGKSMFAEVAPRSDRALRSGTLELSFTAHELRNGVMVTNGVPERETGAFAIGLTAAGAVVLNCSNGGVDPIGTTTTEGFVAVGDQVQVTLSWGERVNFAVVNQTRLRHEPSTRAAGLVEALPLRARIRVTPGQPLTFGAAHCGRAPYFEGQIHRVTLSDSADEPTVKPPTATVHSFEEHRRGPVQPRRIRTPLGPAGSGTARLRAALGRESDTRICVSTSEGERPIAELKVGDEILTREHGFQPLRWVGQVTLDWAALRKRQHLRPVVIRKGSLGQGLPETDLLLPPCQRLASMQGDHEVLLSAKTLVGTRGVFEADAMGATYSHLQFDRSELYLANGVWVEGFNPADDLRGGTYDAQRAELYDLFPALRSEVLRLVGSNADQV